DLLPAKLFAEGDADVVVEAPEERIAPVDEGHFAPEAVQDPRELDRDVAAADHERTSGKRIELEHLVRAHRELGAGDGQLPGPAADGDEDVAGGVAAAVDFDRVRVDDASPARHDLNPGAFEDPAVDAVEASDLGVLGGEEALPVEATHREVPAVAGGVLDLLADVRSVDEEFLGDAAHVDAGAAEACFLGQGDARPVTGGHPRGADAAGATADDEEVELVIHHHDHARAPRCAQARR